MIYLKKTILLGGCRLISLQGELKIFKEKTINTYYNKALDLVKNNNISKALVLMEKSLEDITEDTEIFNLMGLCQYILCDFEKADLTWNKSLMFNNDNNRARYYLNFLKSEEFKSFEEYYNLSLAYVDKLKYKEALELLIEINETNKDLIEPYALIGNCYYGLEEYELSKEYLKKALNKDIDNVQYLKQLNKVNSKVPQDIKRSSKSYKLIFPLIIIFFIIISLSFYNKYNRDLKALSREVDKTKLEYSKLEEELKIEKEKADKKTYERQEVNNDTKLDEEDNSPIIGIDLKSSDLEILKDAMEKLKNKKYDESIYRFQHLIDKSSNEDIKGEALYFMGISFEKTKEYDKAGTYYNLYIKDYKDKVYYDDSLYNYGLMLYEQNDIEGAKKILNKLKNEVPQSEFVNSKVQAILDS